jgi:uncharacterized protein YbjT (DUF2867 family)
VIVVTAAGGPTGTAVVRALWSRGEQVRAVVGSDRPHPELAALSVEIASADLTAPARVEPLLAGASALYLIWPNFDPDEAAGATALLRAAARVGVPRVVYHSVLRPQARSMPHHAAKDRVEEALDSSGLAWRVLQPCAYGANLDGAVADAVATGRLGSAWGLDTAQSLVDLGDVADAAAVLLTEDGLDGGTFEAVGPEPLTAPRIAAILAGRLGRDVTAVDVPPDGPVPPAAEYAAHCLRRMLDHYRAHGFTGSPRVLEAVLGRPTRTFGQHLDRLLPALATVSPDGADGPR